jgi:hypothetical protein
MIISLATSKKNSNENTNWTCAVDWNPLELWMKPKQMMGWIIGKKPTELMVIYTETIMVVEMGPSLKKSC